MVLDIRGQVAFYTFMIAIVIVVLALALAPSLKQFSDIARNDTTDTTIGLNCSSGLLTDWDKGSCVMTDLLAPYFFWSLLGIASLVIAARLIWGG